MYGQALEKELKEARAIAKKNVEVAIMISIQKIID